MNKMIPALVLTAVGVWPDARALAGPKDGVASQQAYPTRPVRAGTMAGRMLRFTRQLHPARKMQLPARASNAVPTTNTAYTPTFVAYPGTPYNAAVGLNLGVSPHAKHYVVGAYGPYFTAGGGSFYGFQATLSDKGSTQIESYKPVLAGMSDMYPYTINDRGDIVGANFANEGVGFLISGGVVTTISVPFSGANLTSANGINNAGLVVGAWSTDGGDTSHGFTWNNGVFTQLPDYPGAIQTWPYSINNHGDMAGYVVDSAGNTHGFLLHKGIYTLLDVPGAAYTIAAAVNDSNQVVGLYCITVEDCNVPDLKSYGFLYSGGTYTTLTLPNTTGYEANGINNAGQIMASYFEGSGYLYSAILTP